jgi:hypothetical protein
VLVEREEARACQDEAGAAGGSYAPTRRRGRGGVGGLIQRFLGPHPQDQGQPQVEGAGPRAPGRGGRRALWVWVDDFGYEVPYAAVEQQAIEHGWLTGKVLACVCVYTHGVRMGRRRRGGPGPGAWGHARAMLNALNECSGVLWWCVLYRSEELFFFAPPLASAG